MLDIAQIGLLLLQIDAVTAEEQKVIAYSDKTDIGRIMMNDDTR